MRLLAIQTHVDSILFVMMVGPSIFFALVGGLSFWRFGSFASQDSISFICLFWQAQKGRCYRISRRINLCFKQHIAGVA